MKKLNLLTILVLSFGLMSLVYAQGAGIHEPGTGLENPELREAAAGTGQGLQEGEVLGAKVALQSGEHLNIEGQAMKVQKQANNRIRIETGGVAAECDCEMTQETAQNRTRLYAKLSNGRNAEIKVMPDRASEIALQRLRLKVCSEENECRIELKEVGQGEEIKSAYEVQIQRHSRILGIFEAKMRVRTEVNAETGEIERVNKPWWAFIATEPAEE